MAKREITPSFKVFTRHGKEIAWDINKVAMYSIEAREKCTKQLAPSVRKNAKSLSSRAVTVRYIARNAFQSVKAKTVKRGYIGKRYLFISKEQERSSKEKEKRRKKTAQTG